MFGELISFIFNRDKTLFLNNDPLIICSFEFNILDEVREALFGSYI